MTETADDEVKGDLQNVCTTYHHRINASSWRMLHSVYLRNEILSKNWPQNNCENASSDCADM